MAEIYRICYQGGQGEIMEKKSRFIAVVRPAETEKDAAAFIEEMRKKYWDARHHCYAYICGKKNPQMKCSDDGEPSQTAGKPMLDVLVNEHIYDVCVVVIRYFGGTLLGTGGLVRAYTQAAKEGLAASCILTLVSGRKLTIKTDYSSVGKIQYLAGQKEISILDSQYTDSVSFCLLVPDEQTEEIRQSLVEATNGTAQISCSEPFYFGENGKEKILFS